MQATTLAFLCVALVAVGVYGARQQFVGIRGRLLCGDQPLNDTKIKLWNKNNLGADDLLAHAKTDEQGNYELAGGVFALFDMNVHFKIYHDCDDGVLPCQRRVDLRIPEQFITNTTDASKFFDAGTMNMVFIFPDEERSCIN